MTVVDQPGGATDYTLNGETQSVQAGTSLVFSLLDGGNTFGGSISQTSTTVVGQAYKLEFKMGIFGRDDISGGGKRKQKLLVTATGTGSLLSANAVAAAAAGGTAISPW